MTILSYLNHAFCLSFMLLMSSVPNLLVLMPLNRNDIIERKYKLLLNVAQILMLQSHVRGCLWEDGILVACHLANQLPKQQNFCSYSLARMVLIPNSSQGVWLYMICSYLRSKGRQTCCSSNKVYFYWISYQKD